MCFFFFFLSFIIIKYIIYTLSCIFLGPKILTAFTALSFARDEIVWLPFKYTHEIPLKDFAEATDNYKMIYQQFKSMLASSTNLKKSDTTDDDRTHRRYLRSTQPCLFFPANEYEQTSQLIDWLHEKAEGNRSKFTVWIDSTVYFMLL